MLEVPRQLCQRLVGRLARDQRETQADGTGGCLQAEAKFSKAFRARPLGGAVAHCCPDTIGIHTFAVVAEADDLASIRHQLDIDVDLCRTGGNRIVDDVNGSCFHIIAGIAGTENRARRVRWIYQIANARISSAVNIHLSGEFSLYLGAVPDISSV
jgi:hypothetical protein